VERLEDAEAALTQNGYDVVRIGYADLIGSERGRDVLVKGFARAVEDGLAFCRLVYGTTPSGDVVPIEGGLEAGLPRRRRLPGPIDSQAARLWQRIGRK
jgi:glutamine synthetase